MLTARGILTLFIVTQARICTSARSTDRYRTASLHELRSPTTSFEVRGFGSPLIPDHYRRQIPRPVSYYALFKWWLLLSQHPGCHGNLTSL